jgi:hypothetical protein
MKEIFNQMKAGAVEHIKKASDDELNSTEFKNSLIKKYTPSKLEYSSEKHIGDVHDISMQQYLTMSNTGGTYNPNSTAQMVSMNKQVFGSTDIFDFLAKNSYLPSGNTFRAMANGNKRYMEFNGYERLITGNNEILSKMKIDSDEKFKGVEKIFNDINNQIDEYSTKELIPIIDLTTASEKEKRQTNKNAKIALR